MAGIGLQPCIMCCLSRQFVGAEPVAKVYEIQTLECPECESVVRLVQRRTGRTKLSGRNVPVKRSAAGVGSVYRPRSAETVTGSQLIRGNTV